jgi:copper transport protein
MPTALTPRRVRRTTLAAALVVVALVLPVTAQAHAFLIRSDPPRGGRVAQAPVDLVLFFSERFVGSSAHLTMRRSDGADVPLPSPRVRGTTIHERLPAGLRGVFVVSWRVLADDGHISLGEFAFAAGSSAALPTVRNSTGQTSGTQVLASWLLFLGLALALGGLVSERFVWRSIEGVPRAFVREGLVLAAVGALTQLVLVAGNRRGSGLLDGFSPAAVWDALGTRPGLLNALTLGAVALAGVALVLRRRVWPLAPLAGAVVAIALRGHAGTSGKTWAVLADVVHLAGAALWVGALAHLITVAARSRDQIELLARGVRRYSRLALLTVLLVGGSGIVSAFAELRHVNDLVDSGYGQTLLVKTGLVSAALALAGSARFWALRGNPSVRLRLLRRLTGVEAAALAGVLLAVSLLVNFVPPRSEAASSSPALGPPPLAGPSVRLATLAGQLVVGLTAGEQELQFTVIAPGDAPAKEVKLSADAARQGNPGADLFPRSCGDGCFTIRYTLHPGETTITAHVSAPGWTGGDATFRVSAPIPSTEPELLRRTVTAMRRVTTLDLVERVSSGPSSAAAPAGYRLNGKAYLATETFTAGAVDVRRVGRERGLTELAFALPGSNLWYRLWIDPAFRIRRELIVSPGHLIKRTFSYPPTPGAAPAPASGKVKPLAGPSVIAREADDLAVGMAAKPAGKRVVLTFTVIAPNGDGANGLQLDTRLAGSSGTSRTVETTVCGPGCYRIAMSSAGAPRAALVTLRRLGHAPIALRFPLPSPWPPVSATAIARRATQAFRTLRSVVYDERLASSPTQVVKSTWTLEAPNRFSYAIPGGSEAIIIGARRWDRDPGKPWQESSIGFGQREPVPFWGNSPRRASLLGSGIVRGRPVWIITFLQPSFPAWFTLWVDKANYHTLELRMVAQVHFMHHVYRDFNRAPPLRPPP